MIREESHLTGTRVTMIVHFEHWSPFIEESNVNDAMSNVKVGRLKEVTLGSKDAKTVKVVVNPHHAGLKIRFGWGQQKV